VVRDPERADDPYAWLAYEGNWGQKARGLFNAPTGPNTNKKWARPIDWGEGLRSSSISVPGEGAFGVTVTGFFCDAVATGSEVYADLLNSPLTASLTLVAVGLVIAGTARLTRAGRRSSSGRSSPRGRPARSYARPGGSGAAGSGSSSASG
jgi:hypothetical protein